MHKFNFQIISCFILATAHLSISAEIYKYTNDKGRKVFVDRLSQVPAKFSDQLIIREVTKHLTSEFEQAAYDLANTKFADDITVRNSIIKLKKLKDSMRTSVIIQGNQVLVPVIVKYAGKKSQLNLLLDTGSSSTVLHRGGLPQFFSKGKKIKYAEVAGGGLIKTWPVLLDYISYGPYNNKRKQVILIKHSTSSNIDGLLGMDLLAGASYKVDYGRRHIIWQQDEYIKIQAKINSLELKLK